jgi:hypothetical protein
MGGFPGIGVNGGMPASRYCAASAVSTVKNTVPLSMMAKNASPLCIPTAPPAQPPGRGAGGPLDQWAPLGDYTVTVSVAGRTLTQTATIAQTQGWSIGGTPQIIR